MAQQPPQVRARARVAPPPPREVAGATCVGDAFRAGFLCPRLWPALERGQVARCSRRRGETRYSGVLLHPHPASSPAYGRTARPPRPSPPPPEDLPGSCGSRRAAVQHPRSRPEALDVGLGRAPVQRHPTCALVSSPMPPAACSLSPSRAATALTRSPRGPRPLEQLPSSYGNDKSSRWAAVPRSPTTYTGISAIRLASVRPLPAAAPPRLQPRRPRLQPARRGGRTRGGAAPGSRSPRQGLENASPCAPRGRRPPADRPYLCSLATRPTSPSHRIPGVLERDLERTPAARRRPPLATGWTVPTSWRR